MIKFEFVLVHIRSLSLGTSQKLDLKEIMYLSLHVTHLVYIERICKLSLRALCDFVFNFKIFWSL